MIPDKFLDIEIACSKSTLSVQTFASRNFYEVKK